VTYLTSKGAPTLIVNKSAPTFYTDPLNGQADEVAISRPEPCKHISFDGRFLHGAPCELMEIWGLNSTANADDENAHTGKGKKKKADGAKTAGRKKKKSRIEIPLNEMRITFLVNVWINHKPMNAVPFQPSSSPVSPCKADGKIFTPNEKPLTTWTHGSKTTNEKKTNKAGSEIKPLQWSFKQHKKQTLQIPIPMQELSVSPFKESDSIVLHYPNKLKPAVM